MSVSRITRRGKILGQVTEISQDQIFYVKPFLRSETSKEVHLDHELVPCYLSKGKRVPSIDDLVIVEILGEYDPSDQKRKRHSRVVSVVPKSGCITLAQVVDCTSMLSDKSDMLDARVYVFSENNTVMYPTSDIIKCIPMGSYNIKQDRTLRLHDGLTGDFLVLLNIPGDNDKLPFYVIMETFQALYDKE